jgi:hypothetical protein
MKPIRKFLSSVILFTLSLSLVPLPTLAVLPPDVIFGITNQASQVFTIISALVLGLSASVLPFFASLIQNKWLKTLLYFFGILGLLFVWSYVLLYFYQPNQGSINPLLPSDNKNGGVKGAVEYKPGFRFYSDRFIFVAKHSDGTPIALEIYSNRKELEKGGFLHYYSLLSVDGSTRGNLYKTITAPDSSVLPNLLFTDFTRNVAADHSSREFFSFTLSDGAKTYTLTTNEMQGDFITKNEPEYTQYTSVGPATVQTGSEAIVGNLMYQRIYSTDYRPTLFFDGFESLPSEATQVILWDELGNFYLADKSEVHKVSSEYSSHFWALQKNFTGPTSKSFSGELTHKSRIFTGSVPELGIHSLSLTLSERFKSKALEGYAEGKLIDAAGVSHFVFGVVHFSEYGVR